MIIKEINPNLPKFMNDAQYATKIIGDQLKKKEAEDIINLKKECSEIIKSYRKLKQYIWRGMSNIARSSNEKLIVYDPKSFKEPRVSAHADYNIYTLIMNNDKTWKMFPKRSLICTTNYEKAEDYGKPVLVFPINGTKIAGTYHSDIWDNDFNTLSIQIVNLIEETLDVRIPHGRNKASLTWEMFQDLISRFFKESTDNDDKEYMRGCLSDLTPGEDFYITNTKELETSEMSEVWIDSKAYLILDSELIKSILGFMPDELIS